MEWRDEGVILSARSHGESAAIVEIFTETHGRHAGVVRGGASRKMTPVLQPGSQVAVVWRARLEEHMGAFTVEPLRSRAAVAMADRLALDGLNAVCALLSFCLPEREEHGALYRTSIALLDLLGTEHWPRAYVAWELALLDEMGFGLDLAECAVTGANDGLVFVSPKSGRAVTASGAGDWAERLLPLPPCLLGQAPRDMAEIVQALGTTGHFLHNRLAPELASRPLPAARARLVERLSRPRAP